MTDASFATKARASTVRKKASTLQSGRVSLSRLPVQGFASNRDAAGGCYFEEYEIGIGAWKATIVKVLDYGSGRTRLRARYEADQKAGRPERQRRHSVRRRRARRYVESF
ncbi:hypothetical protein MesoLjLc_71240 [Mesorhizobium sp. L-8-10]|uniref:hypothetical protein n=1 Tax=unclassified Mesorhizobium TaxID=325217 RepID=UPI0019262DE8|nr:MULTISPECIES: hypothetical protein [unclassified Mesorhizobium]BCH27236.1 hypothetical protein MesoLjLb_70210 [Mesorhizobium sp. L-8-3]BCH35194.1 hypothetical protein MesoLjLc_71240 [Mesorhizobium sp. L-8-10]